MHEAAFCVVDYKEERVGQAGQGKSKDHARHFNVSIPTCLVRKSNKKEREGKIVEEPGVDRVERIRSD